MPRYFFNVVDDAKVYPDTEGIDLAGPEAARDYAQQDAKDLVDQRLMPPARVSQGRIEVVDEAGAPIVSVPLPTD